MNRSNRSRSVRTSRSTKRSNKRILNFEQLEDRTTPSTGTVIFKAFVDDNLNCLWDSGEAAMSGVDIWYGGPSGSGNVTTGQDGTATAQLEEDNYGYGATAPAGYEFNPAAAENGSGTIVIVPNSEITVLLPLVEIGGGAGGGAGSGSLNIEAFNDVNENAAWDANELGIAGVEVSYTGMDAENMGVFGNLTTEADGTANATLITGNYSFSVTLPSAYEIEIPFAIFGEFTIVEGQPDTRVIPALDVRPIVTIAADDTTVTEGASGTTSFTVSRTGDWSQPLTVPFAVGGTANEGTDFDLSSHEITIPMGEDSASIDIQVVDDNWDEDDETIAIGLLSTEDYQVGTPDWASITLESNAGDTDVEPLPVVEVTSTVSISVSENDFTETDAVGPNLIVSREGPKESDLTVYLEFGGSAVNGVDYDLPSEVVIPAGEVQIEVPFEPIDDGGIEGEESITATLVDTETITAICRSPCRCGTMLPTRSPLWRSVHRTSMLTNRFSWNRRRSPRSH